MGRVRRFTPDEVDLMERLYSREGWSLNRIARHTNRYPSGVLTALRRRGVRIRPRGGINHHLPQREVAHTVELYLRGGPGGHGMTIGEVGEVLGRTPSTVWERLHQAGAIRTRVETAAMMRLRRGQSLDGLSEDRPRLTVVEGERARRLPAAPFAEWLRSVASEYTNGRVMADALGMDDSYMSHLMHDKYLTVSEDLVDRALIREGRTLLWELYPDDDRDDLGVAA